MIKKLNDFYLLDDKLLYVCKDFVGFNPTISKPLFYESVRFGTKVRVDEFEMNGSSFKVILTNFFEGGPVRGYKRIEIIKNGRTIIQNETGSYGYGGNYSKGNLFFVENSSAYLVAKGAAMRDSETHKIYSALSEGSYFFEFTDFIIPTRAERVFYYDSLIEKEIYSVNEIKYLRQTEWYAEATFNNHKINISKSSIPGFEATIGWQRDEWAREFRRSQQSLARREIKILEDGIIHFDERYNGS